MDQKHKGETAYNYKGIGIHAAQGLHEYAINVVLKACTKGSQILDLGCGSGAFSKRLQDNGFITTSVDLSLDTFSLDSDKLEIDLNSNFTEKVHEKKYDAVVALEVIEHLENPLHFLRQLKQLTDNKTVIIVSFPNIHLYSSVFTFYKNGTFGNWTPSLYWESGHQTIIPDWLFEEHLKKIGFAVEGKHFCGYFDPPVGFIKRRLHNIFYYLVCFFNKGVPPSARANQIILFSIKNNS